jgi:simple sugar transport system substrate-binding protein
MLKRLNRNAPVGFAIAAGLALAAGLASQSLGAGVATRGQAQVRAKPLVIKVVGNGPLSTDIYHIMFNGAKQAAKDLGVTVTYSSPRGLQFDPVEQARLLDNVLASKPDGLVTTMPTPSLAASVKKVVDAGIPVAVANTGGTDAIKAGALLFAGADEFAAGVAAGAELKKAGVKHVICTTLPPGIPVVDARCAGLAKGLGGKTTKVIIDLADPTGMRNRIEATIQKDKTIDGVMSLGTLVAPPAVAAKAALGERGNQIVWATWDLSTPILQAVRDKKFAFAVDQQPFLQGYVTVQAVVFKIRYGFKPVNPSYLTGPALVFPADAAKVLALSTQFIR